MLNQKKEHPKEKTGLHPRNKHRERYDFLQLINTCTELAPFVKLNKFRDESIDYFNPQAVKALNSALLKHYYEIGNWDIPKNYLCPPIPGRADYIHYMADLLYGAYAESENIKKTIGEKITCLDIGVGASCIYPIIGIKEYGWSFIASDIDPKSLESAKNIIETNASLKGKITLRLQANPKDIFIGIIQKDELIDLTICNPPFHASSEEAQFAAIRKLRNLKHKKVKQPILNFGGINSELWCEGGEEKFVGEMIAQSKLFQSSCFWFSTLISNQSSLKNAYKALQNIEAIETKTIPMSQGNKSSRIVAWTFLDKKEQIKWMKNKLKYL